MRKLFLFDVEGTTTDINFVHQVLFPYSSDRLEAFVRDQVHRDDVREAMRQIDREVGVDLSIDEALSVLQQWIREDRKHMALKTLQGLIWDEGYRKGDFKGHVYPDVKPFFEELKRRGHEIGIYSSGSVHAQRLIFGFSDAGDLTPFISLYFDTKVGGKREKVSYEKIALEANLRTSDILFFSDVPEELQAAEDAGMKVYQVLREGTTPSKFEALHSFSKFNLR